MQHEGAEIVNAYKEDDKGQRTTREFTKTQWENMSRDKAGWRIAAPDEASTAEPEGGQTSDEAKLLEARQRYEALFERKPHHSSKLETIEAAIAAELKRQNAGGSPRTDGNGGNDDAKKSDAETGKQPAAPGATGANGGTPIGTPPAANQPVDPGKPVDGAPGTNTAADANPDAAKTAADKANENAS